MVVKIGIVGCGGISYYHVNNLFQVENAKVVAFCDVSLERARKLRDYVYRYRELKPNEMVYEDYKELITSEELDGVYILTPHAYHFEQAMYALQHNLHVLVEKPMCIKPENARRLIKEAERRKRVLLVSYQRHYMPIFRYVKRAIGSGEIGNVRLITVRLGQDWIKPCTGTWRVNPDISGGGELIDSGSHVVDIVHWLVDKKPIEVFAHIYNDGAPVDVYSHVVIRLEDNITAAITINGNYKAIWMEEEAIDGTDGTVYIRNGRVSIVKEGQTRIPMRLPPGSTPDANFINCILGKEKNESPGIYGYIVALVTQAAYRSAKEGKPVKITL